MRHMFLVSIAALLVLGFAASAGAQAIVPAGTLLQCTLSEPSFSSATANVGDPVVCYLRTLQQFGRIVLPAGSYLAGHLAAAKEPGHLWSKGSLRLEFDRIGFPNTDVPLPTKVIAASGGYKTDRDGDVRGKGHATRDTVEWMLPPLWPLKMIMLPARGPRPTLRGEEILTLRLMDDLELPKAANVRPALAPGWHYFDEPQLKSRSSNDQPATKRDTSLAAAENSSLSLTGARTTFIALKSNEVVEVTRYRIDSGRLTYALADGARNSVAIDEVDWTKTSQLNLAKSPTGTSVMLSARAN
jgi:hypothetical protein